MSGSVDSHPRTTCRAMSLTQKVSAGSPTSSRESLSAGIRHCCHPSDRALPGVPPSTPIFPASMFSLRTSAMLSPSAHRFSPTTVR